VHTIHDARDALFAAIHAGAVGYVLKGESLDALASGILDAVEGRAPISPAVARYFVDAFRAEVPAGDAKPLTDRETELLGALAAGLTYADVAERMGISRHTVHTHAKNIYHKLHASGRTQAIRTAKLSGLLDPPADHQKPVITEQQVVGGLGGAARPRVADPEGDGLAAVVLGQGPVILARLPMAEPNTMK
jgi:DNA-binding CsgD family transcriptional regulator